MTALLWFLLGGAVALSVAIAMERRNTAARTRTFQNRIEAQAWAALMDEAGYDAFLCYEVRCYRRKGSKP